MNKVLKITENWFIDCEDANNCILTFKEERIREKKTGEQEQYDYLDEYYYPNVQSALVKYLQLCQEEAKTVMECIELTNRVIKEIKQLKF